MLGRKVNVEKKFCDANERNIKKPKIEIDDQ